MGNVTQAQRDAIVKEKDAAGRKVAAERLGQTAWHGKLEELKSSLEGSVHLPTDEDSKYDDCRNRAWNKDQRGFPLAIVRVKHTADVSATIRFIRSHITDGTNICVASGCHSSRCMVTDAFVIDLANINQVSYDQTTHRVQVGGGAYLEQIDLALEPYNRAVPIGTYPKTGVGGLTLGGGFGWLTRLHGLTVDNFLEAEIVLNDGRVVIANDDNEYSDLMWGLRGGGGNFGIVTKFTYQSHQLPPSVLTGAIVKLAPTQSAAKTVFQNYDRNIANYPATLSSGIVFPAGAPVVVTMWAHFGKETSPSEVPIFKEIPNFGGWPTVENSVKKKTYYRDLQHFTEPMNPSGFDYHTVLPFGNLNETLSEQLIDSLLSFARQAAPAKVSKAAFILLNLARPDEEPRDPTNEKTAIPLSVRQARYFGLVQAAWQPEHGDEGKAAAKQWVKTGYEILKPYFTADVYAPDEINATLDERNVRYTAENSFGYTLDVNKRIAVVKAKYDPENFFHMNLNIKPAK